MEEKSRQMSDYLGGMQHRDHKKDEGRRLDTHAISMIANTSPAKARFETRFGTPLLRELVAIVKGDLIRQSSNRYASETMPSGRCRQYDVGLLLAFRNDGAVGTPQCRNVETRYGWVTGRLGTRCAP
jgi:hypothetical protein